MRCFELSGVDAEKSIIFTSMPELGVPYDQDIYQYLKDCFRNDLYVIFLFSRSFYNSNVCIAETGAAWATNQKYSNVVIDMGFDGIDKPINNSQLGISLANIDANDLRFKLKGMIKNALSAIGSDPTWLKYKQTNKTIQNRLLHCLSSLFSTTPYLNHFPAANDHGLLAKL